MHTCLYSIISQLFNRELLRTNNLDDYLTFCKTQILGCNQKESKFSSEMYNKAAVSIIEFSL